MEKSTTKMSTQDKIDKLTNTLDLEFSDFYENENVRQVTFEEKLDTLVKAVEIMRLEEAISFSISSSLGEKHPSAEIYAIDFPSDIRASIYLLLGGYYKQAILCLRNWLEIRLIGVYYGFVKQNDRAEYINWKQGNKKSSIWTRVN